MSRPTEHSADCDITARAVAYREYIRHFGTTVAEMMTTDEFEVEPDCTCYVEFDPCTCGCGSMIHYSEPVELCTGCDDPQTDNYVIAGQLYCWHCYEAYDEGAKTTVMTPADAAYEVILAQLTELEDAARLAFMNSETYGDMQFFHTIADVVDTIIDEKEGR